MNIDDFIFYTNPYIPDDYSALDFMEYPEIDISQIRYFNDRCDCTIAEQKLIDMLIKLVEAFNKRMFFLEALQ